MTFDKYVQVDQLSTSKTDCRINFDFDHDDRIYWIKFKNQKNLSI